MVTDFESIKLLATPAGKVQIIDEAAYHDVRDEVARKLTDLEDFYACAFWLLLEQPKCWNGAVFYAAADAKPKRYWRKRINMPRMGRAPTQEDASKLAVALTDLFRRKEGRGDFCVVHPYRRGGGSTREYYFAYPQDHKQTAIEYDKGEMTKRPHNPAFEIVFIHDDEAQTLAIWHAGTMDRVKDLQVAFASAVIDVEILLVTVSATTGSTISNAFSFRTSPYSPRRSWASPQWSCERSVSASQGRSRMSLRSNSEPRRRAMFCRNASRLPPGT